MLLALAGLPGTGKSTLAARLAPELQAVVLCKDVVRAALFPAPVLVYSREQDDLCMAAIYEAAAAIRRGFPERGVILDGRTYLRAYQVRDLLALGELLHEQPHLIECVCSDAVAQARLGQDLAQGRHPAGNRTFALYRSLQAAAEPITVPHLVLDTGMLSLEDCVARSLAYLQSQGTGG